MESKNNKPNIRFSGFSDDWQQHKVENLGNIVTGSTPSTTDPMNYGGDCLFVSPADIRENRYINNTITKLSDKGFSQGRILREGSILFVSIGSTIGKVGQIKSLATTNQQINSIEPTDDFNDDFIYTLMKFKSSRIKLLAATQAVPIINKTLFSQVDVNIPVNIKEQTQIGFLFSNLDNLITLHQRKCDNLEIFKKTLLDKLFPKNKETKPLYRFNGFLDDWEQRKLKEAIESELKGKAKAEMSGDESEYLDANYLNGGEAFYVNSPRDVEEDDVIILWDGSQAGTVYYGFKGALGSTLKAYKPKESGSFLYQFLKRNQQRIYNNYRTPNIPHVIKTFADEFDIGVPSFEEQVQIGAFFAQLNNLITLHQRKIEQLQQMKQYFLKNMFV